MKGTCHCGAVVPEVTLTDGLTTAQRCDCSFCRRRGAIVVTAPLNGVTVVQGADNMTLYQWGTRTAQHWFCKTCGIYTITAAGRTPMNTVSTWRSWRASTRVIWERCRGPTV